MSHISHQRSLATELTTFRIENKTQALVVIMGLNWTERLSVLSV